MVRAGGCAEPAAAHRAPGAVHHVTGAAPVSPRRQMASRRRASRVRAPSPARNSGRPAGAWQPDPSIGCANREIEAVVGQDEQILRPRRVKQRKATRSGSVWKCRPKPPAPRGKRLERCTSLRPGNGADRSKTPPSGTDRKAGSAAVQGRCRLIRRRSGYLRCPLGRRLETHRTCRRRPAAPQWGRGSGPRSRTARATGARRLRR